MVACRRGDHSAGKVLPLLAKHEIERTANFEGTRFLQVFAFEVDRIPKQLTEMMGVHELCPAHQLSQSPGGVQDQFIR
jgi:hypothetical protein